MKRFLQILILFVCLHSNAYSAHIIGGQFRYFYVSKNEFKIQIELNLDKSSGGAGFESIFIIGMYSKSSNQLIKKFSLYKDSIVRNRYDFDCTTPYRSFESGYYSASIYIDKDFISSYDSTGYYFSWERCCLTHDIVNIFDPTESTFLNYIDIPKLNISSNDTTPFINSSPYKKINFYFPLLCLNKDFNFDFSYIDPDGDSLVYEIVTPLEGYLSTAFNPAQATNSKPFDKIIWAEGFSDNLIIPSDPYFKINRHTGLITMKPKQIGNYLFSVAIHEYKNGKKIGSVIHTSTLLITDCMSSLIEHPKSQYAALNSTVTFRVKHTDTLALYYWQYNDGTGLKFIQGENNDSLVLTNITESLNNNKYRCVIKTPKFCDDFSDYATLRILGVGIDNKNSKDFKLYPNPTQSVVYFSDNVLKNIKLYSSDGRLLTQKHQVNQIDISDLTNGVYIIKLESLDGKLSWVKQIIKQ